MPRALALALPLLLLAAGLASCAEPAQNMPGPVRLALPPVLYAVVGQEMNVYFDNVVLVVDPTDYVFDVTCPRGIQQAERWTCLAAPNEVGSCPFMLEVRDGQNTIIARATSRLEIVPADAGKDRNLSVLMVGDSLTHASVYPEHVLKLSKTPGNPRVKLLGSHHPDNTPPEIHHEGYGGWTAHMFAHHWTGVARQGRHTKRGSPFLYEDDAKQKKLDFARYLKDIGAAEPPDFVTIFLGPNDVYSAGDESIEAGIDTMLTAYDQLIAMVRAASPKTRIGVMLPVPPAGTQDAFGIDSRNGQTRWQYKRNQHRLVERMLARYAGRESENLFVVPTEVNLDCLHNYPSATVKANAHADVEITRLTNAVHPAASGYRQIGDTLFAWIKSQSR